MKTCVWCKRNEQIDAYVGVCSLQCSREYMAYQRGKADERAAVVAYIDKWGPWYPGIEKGEHEVKR